MILTLPVLAYQLFFVGLLYAASRVGLTALRVVTVLSLLWTATHLFFPPLAVLQAVVILVSYMQFRKRHLAPRPRHGQEAGRAT